MKAPPGIEPVTEPLPGDQAGEGHRPLISKRQAFRTMREQLGITGAQAHQMFADYTEQMTKRIGNQTGKADHEFIDWLMREMPLGARRPRKVRHNLGWSVRSA